LLKKNKRKKKVEEEVSVQEGKSFIDMEWVIQETVDLS